MPLSSLWVWIQLQWPPLHLPKIPFLDPSLMPLFVPHLPPLQFVNSSEKRFCLLPFSVCHGAAHDALHTLILKISGFLRAESDDLSRIFQEFVLWTQSKGRFLLVLKGQVIRNKEVEMSIISGLQMEFHCSYKMSANEKANFTPLLVVENKNCGKERWDN